jgi:hypothetical protein
MRRALARNVVVAWMATAGCAHLTPRPQQALIGGVPCKICLPPAGRCFST